MYKQVNSDLSFTERESEVEKFWEENDIFKKSIDSRKEGPVYTFYDGPPTANGKPHIGHVETRTIKDMIPRYRTMKGYQVPRKAGWDTHGLPVELEVEKLLGINGKEQIESYGLEPFIDKCKESVWKYKGMWEDFSATVGFWADMDDPYITYEDIFGEKYIYVANEGRDTDTEADYAWVNLFLRWPAPSIQEDLYVMGAINNWNFDERNLMHYDYQLGSYLCQFLLKQGYYNFMFVAADRDTGRVSTDLTAGNHWDTFNLYRLYFYYYNANKGYDELIGYTTVTSH